MKFNQLATASIVAFSLALLGTAQAAEKGSKASNSKQLLKATKSVQIKRAAAHKPIPSVKNAASNASSAASNIRKNPNIRAGGQKNFTISHVGNAKDIPFNHCKDNINGAIGPVCRPKPNQPGAINAGFLGQSAPARNTINSDGPARPAPTRVHTRNSDGSWSHTRPNGDVHTRVTNADGSTTTFIKRPSSGNQTESSNEGSSGGSSDGSSKDTKDSSSSSGSSSSGTDTTKKKDNTSSSSSGSDTKKQETTSSETTTEDKPKDEPKGKKDEATGADDRGTRGGRGTALKAVNDIIAEQQTGNDGCSKQPSVLVNPMGTEGGCSSGKKPSGPEAESDDREAGELFGERTSATSTNPMDLISQPVTEGGNGIHSYDEQSTATYFEKVGNPSDL